jgi:hypothetical protein
MDGIELNTLLFDGNNIKLKGSGISHRCVLVLRMTIIRFVRCMGLSG